MLLHRESSSVLADSFELYANAYERTILLREFYGKEAGLFSLTSGSEEDKERAKKGLSGVLEGADNERRRRILGAVKDNLVTMYVSLYLVTLTHANYTGHIDSIIRTKALLRMLSSIVPCGSILPPSAPFLRSQNKKKCEERFSKRQSSVCSQHALYSKLFRCQDMLAEMVHTKDGSRVVRQFLAQGGAKVRGINNV